MTSLFPEAFVSGAERITNPFVAGQWLNVVSHSYPLSMRRDKTSGTTSGAASPADLYVNKAALMTGTQPKIRSHGGARVDYILAMMIGGCLENFGPWDQNVDRGFLLWDTIRNSARAYLDSGGANDPTGACCDLFGECTMSALRWVKAAPPESATVGIHEPTLATGWNFTTGYIGARAFYRGRCATTPSAASTPIPTDFTGPEVLLWSLRLRDSWVLGGELEVLYSPTNPTNPGAGGAQVIKTIPCHGGFPDPSGFLNFYHHSTRLTSADVNAVFGGSTGFAAGLNRIWVRKKAGDTKPVYYQAWATPGPTIHSAPPRTALIQDGDETIDSAALVGATRLHQAYVDYRAKQTVIAALPEFSAFTTAISPPDWVPETSTDSQSPWVHPATRGQYQLAIAVVRWMNQLNTWDQGVHVV